jgi:uncharacterized protein YjbI with pentapeptide repeats
MNESDFAVLNSGVSSWNKARKEGLATPDLSYADLKGMWLAGVDFSDTDLSNADLSFANLRGANFVGAKLDGTIIQTASISGAVFEEAKFSASSARLLEVRKKEFTLKILESIRVDLPTRRAKVIEAHFDGERLILNGRPASSEESFRHLITHIERIVRECLASGRYSNTAPEVHRALVRYAEAIDGYHAGEGEINIGLAGNLVFEEIGAFEKSEGEHFQGLMGTLRDIRFSHTMLERLLTDWNNFLADAGMDVFSNLVVGDISLQVDDISLQLTRSPNVSNDIPETLRLLLKFMKDPGLAAKQLSFAIIRGVEDVISELFNFVFDLYNKTKEKIISVGSAIAAVSIITSLVNSSGLINLMQSNPTLFKWVRQGVDWLKSQGFSGS